MLWMMFQALVAFSIISANIYFGFTQNGYIAAAWGVCGAYALTVFPFQIYDWWTYRHDRRRMYALAKEQGLTYGWRRHLPWNAKKSSRVRIDVPSRVLHEEGRGVRRMNRRIGP